MYSNPLLLLLALLGPTAILAQLNVLARKAGKLYFGTATDTGELGNTTYYSILTNTSEFGQLVPSNGQKWIFTEPLQGVFNFTEGHIVTDITQKTGQLLRCHNLVWHSQLAPWVENTTWTAETLAPMLEEHVFREAREWKGKCYAWDVVNEALDEDGSFRESVFFDILGPEFIKIAFRAAARADPGAKLYYNDYNIESPGNKSAAARTIVKMLQDDGIKVDGVGLQSHFVVGSTPSIDEQIETMRGYADLGVEVAITELDIRLDLPANTSNLAQQKEDYKKTVGACMQVKECIGITVWDFWDPVSWVPSVFEGQGAATLYFDNFTKHPAYYGVVEALTNKTDGGKPGCKSRREAKRSKPSFP
ncbi:glycoside hydrolase superfamily [Pseudomassariella vexata]|uniref:Beta-xylanase n=1 Tax=Pseudomassariella vexata TaxID=1141098 RepID=A0A1Y2DV84_9PEZI|nr:glycoside hydrolase superfamily [Pseudomassariella vexata]ORY63158.1 glycoside hydrolase superfamily [Pseudomassariella vexata]